MIPKPGQVVHIGPACGVPYDIRPIYLAVIEVTDHQPHAPGAWIAGYEMNLTTGRASDRRDIYVGQLDGLRLVLPSVPRRRPTVPQQRARTAPATTTSGRTR